MTGSFSSMIELLETGPKGLAAAREAVAYTRRELGSPIRPDGGLAVPLKKVKLMAPIPNARKVLALAGNYAEHIMEGGGRLERQDKETPRVFMMPPSTTLCGSGDPIRITPIARTVDYEGELAVVIGRRAKGVRAADAMKYVAGFTCLNDVSERELVIRKRSEDRPMDKWFDWLNGKWLDSFAPCGPWMTTVDEIGDPHNLGIQTRVNGDVRQKGNTGQMIFQIGDVIEYIGAVVTLEPGDLISTGTPAGVGHTTRTFLKPGDKVEVEIEKIGVLVNVCKSSR
ncbi:MAG: fumarylacetoacetate hydrolase family protein [Planctomycetes bacterium]|nr:fumarylacetoacetate hydrolase family protein [Planctomycetota bacterium]